MCQYRSVLFNLYSNILENIQKQSVYIDKLRINITSNIVVQDALTRNEEQPPPLEMYVDDDDSFSIKYKDLK